MACQTGFPGSPVAAYAPGRPSSDHPGPPAAVRRPVGEADEPERLLSGPAGGSGSPLFAAPRGPKYEARTSSWPAGTVPASVRARDALNLAARLRCSLAQ